MSFNLHAIGLSLTVVQHTTYMKGGLDPFIQPKHLLSLQSFTLCNKEELPTFGTFLPTTFSVHCLVKIIYTKVISRHVHV